MSLRTRLVIALLAMTALGLTIFGAGTYQAFASAERDRLDDDLRASVELVARELAVSLQLGGPPLGSALRETPLVVPPGTYAELREGDEVVASLQFSRSESLPDLSRIGAGGVDGLVTVASRNGSVQWRVLTNPTLTGGQLVVAAPMSAMERSLQRLLTIELVTGAILLGALAAGALWLLRRELRPLERIADTAASIDEGRLEQRVPTDAHATEVDQLARAINGMLDELQGAFAAREATEARLRRFLADASHELRTPLTSIQGFAELFRLDEQRRQVELPVLLRRIEQESERMRGLVEDLLLLARLDETRPPELADVDLAVLAADACSDAVARDPDRPVRLDAPAPVVVRGDAAHLRQAVGNLVANALRHTPAGTAIEVAARRDGAEALVEVRDHGPGFDDESLERAFERFYQADPARTGSGTGLGLSIVHAVAAEHDGAVRADNHPEGGARVTIRLPAGHAGPPPPPPEALAPPDGPEPPEPDGASR